MQGAVLSGLAAAALLSACASPPPPEVEYLPPSGAPAGANRALVQQPPALVWGQLVDRLQQSPLTVRTADPQTGLLIATYSGEAAPYVDCGWLVTYGQENLAKLPAAARQTSLIQEIEGEPLALQRDLKLDGRLAVQVEPDGFGTLVTTEGTYVLTKTIAAADRSGPRGRAFEVMSFTTGESGQFEKGTRCQPTGELERVALGALPALASIGPRTRGGRAPVISEADLDCAGADRTYCAVLDLVAPYRQSNAQEDLGLAVQTAGPGGPILTQGDDLTLDVSLPRYDAYLHVAYIQRDGVVGHIVPGAQVWPANARRYVEETGYEIAEPYGIEMILAVATEQPLFPTARPRFERVEDYLAALRERLTAIEAQNSDSRIAADPLFVRTQPFGAVSSSF